MRKYLILLGLVLGVLGARAQEAQWSILMQNIQANYYDAPCESDSSWTIGGKRYSCKEDYIREEFVNIPLSGVVEGKFCFENDDLSVISGPYFLNKLSQREGTLLYYDNMGLPDMGFQMFNDLVPDSNNGLWIGSDVYGLIHYKGEHQISTYGKGNSELKSDNVKSLLSDSLGGLWVGTDANELVNFYQGSWKSFTINAPASDIVEGNDGDIWISTQGDGVQLLKNGDFTDFNKSNSNLLTDSIQFMAGDRNGGVWCWHEGAGLSHFDGDSWEVLTLENSSLPTNSISDLIVDAQGVLWISLADDGVARYNGTDWMVFKGAAFLSPNFSTRPQLFYLTREGVLYASSYEGLLLWDGLSWKSKYLGGSGISVGPKAPIMSTGVVDLDGSVWVGGEQGVSRRSLDGTWDYFTTDNSGIPDNIIAEVAIDSKGNVWCGAHSSDGVSKFDGQNWELFSPQNSGFTQGSVGEMVIDRDDNVWIISSSSLFKYDGVSWVEYNESNSGYIKYYYRSLDIDTAGCLWMLYGNGLVKYDGVLWDTLTPSNSMMPSYDYLDLKIDNQNQFWLGTKENGLVRFNGQDWEVFDTLNSNLISNHVDHFVLDNQNLWMSHEWNGIQALTKIDGKDFISDSVGHYRHMFVNPISSLNPFLIDTEGRVWCEDGYVRLVIFNNGAPAISPKKLHISGSIDSPVPQDVLLLPDSVFVQTSGSYSFPVDTGKTYTVKCLPKTSWELVKDTTYQVKLGDNSVTGLDFVVRSTAPQPAMKTVLSAGINRCSLTVPFWLNYRNQSDEEMSGQVELVLDSNVTYARSSKSLSAQTDKILTWDYSGLQPNEERQIQVWLEMPDFNQMGEDFLYVAKVSDGNGNAFADTLSATLRCSYDPNDKLVTPAGVCEGNYVEKDDWIDYTIRFQNTGNDTAFKVLLLDTLSASFDLETFEVIASSHTLETSFGTSGEVRFLFEDILLPDSTTNESESHGFVRYRIKPKALVADKSVVKNTAYIYFDYNPAVVTNTTSNTLVEDLSSYDCKALGFEPLVEKEHYVYPNPSTGVLNVKVEGVQKIEVLNLSGQHLYSKDVVGQEEIQINLESEHGIYLVKMHRADSVIVEKVLID